MKATLDLKTIQYINLLEKLVGVKAKYCFSYNSAIVFIVPRSLIGKALGKNCSNLEKISSRLNRKIRIIIEPLSINEIEKFVHDIVYPYQFKKLIHENDTVTIFSNLSAKAALIGRGKTRMNELSDILEKFFGVKKLIIR